MIPATKYKTKPISVRKTEEMENPLLSRSNDRHKYRFEELSDGGVLRTIKAALGIDVIFSQANEQKRERIAKECNGKAYGCC